MAASTRTDLATPADLRALDGWSRAANHLSVGQIHLLGNPLLEGGSDGEDHASVHERMAQTMDEIVAEIARIRARAAAQLAAAATDRQFLGEIRPGDDHTARVDLPPDANTLLSTYDHRLTYRRTSHRNIHVRGYKKEATITPFDMVMLNDLDRFHLAVDVIDRVPGPAVRHTARRQFLLDERLRCRRHTRLHGEDAPDVVDWTWQ